MIRNDLHVHSVQSHCGQHTLWEIARIAQGKGMRLVNISDHGPMQGRAMSYGVITHPERVPRPAVFPDGATIIMLGGIEANILDETGAWDVPAVWLPRFDLVSAGFHDCGDLPRNGDPAVNTRALENLVQRAPLDLLTHPCLLPRPLEMSAVVDLAVEHGFALELNNTGLRLGKMDLDRHRQMVTLAVERGARLVECSDGHTWMEIGENEAVEAELSELGLDGEGILLNRDDVALDAFLEERRLRRAP